MDITENKDASMHHYLTPVTETTNKMLLEGFTCQFRMEDDLLKCMDDNKTYLPHQVKIIKHFRFEGSSDPGDMTILYALETEDGHKGIVVDAFGTYSDDDLGEFIKKVEEFENKNNPMAKKN